MKKWKCTICKYVHEGEEPPEKCPICKAPASKFILLEEKSKDSENSAKIKELEEEIEKQKVIIKENRSGIFKLYDFITDQMVKHHAHPVSVHFPNGALPLAVMLFIMALVFNNTNFAKAGFYNIVFVILAMPFVIFAGYVEWCKKYNKAMTVLFQTKIVAASITAVTCLGNVIWYIMDPNVINSQLSWLFILLNIIMLASAGIAGHLGGKLVFKD